jgi:hypothetical protein
VRYYLAVLCSPRQGERRLEVAYEVERGLFIYLLETRSLLFQNMLPRFPVLNIVYHGIRECLQYGIGDIQIS